jgi:hypothetical protein
LQALHESGDLESIATDGDFDSFKDEDGVIEIPEEVLDDVIEANAGGRYLISLLWPLANGIYTLDEGKRTEVGGCMGLFLSGRIFGCKTQKGAN